MKRRPKKVGTRIPTEFRRAVGHRLRSQMKKEITKSGRTCGGFFVEHADKIGVSKQAMYFWYEGWTLPTIYNLFRLCNYFEWSVDYAFGLHGTSSLSEIKQALAAHRKKSHVIA